MKSRILVVDDESDIVDAISMRLASEGYDVVSALDGKAAMEKAYTCKPDIILLDIMLPKMDGYMVCGLLKGDVRYKKIPIILFTALGQDEDQQAGQKVGADAYILKPFKAETVLSKIKELLNAKQ